MCQILKMKQMQLLVHIWKDTETNGRQQLITPYQDRQYGYSFWASII